MSFLIGLLEVLLVICSLFLVGLVLIQRGKGGGLAGAFGGAGGSSAFGTKAGDVFTKITIIAAGVWIGLNMLLVILANSSKTSALGAVAPTDRSQQVAPSTTGGDPSIPPPIPSPTSGAGAGTATPGATPPTSAGGPSAPAPLPPAGPTTPAKTP